MSLPAIEVCNLSKRYIIQHESRHDNLRDTLHHVARKLWRRARWGTGFETEEFMALNDVSFSVQPGEVVGIIGRNGAGKSTLLKILSRITEPTAGKITIRGRVASLLEVGTGFHPDLTGRENIYLNGAILGMSRVEIRKKFDEIVAFAEIEKFLDTPVKRYSSGMYVRLAFSVAAHLEPEILIVDEVLAVGDANFQKKCLGKMRSVSRESGRTVLFVSHDLSAVSALTSRCLLLDKGKVLHFSSTAEVISRYINQNFTATTFTGHPDKPGKPYISSIHLETSEGGTTQVAGKPLTVRISLRHDKPVNQACVSIQLVNQFQQPATHAWCYHTEKSFATHPGETTLVCRFPDIHLNVGSYSVRAYFSEPPGGESFQTVEQVCPFEVVILGKTTLWGWRSDACVYHEPCEWSIIST